MGGSEERNPGLRKHHSTEVETRNEFSSRGGPRRRGR